VRAQAHLGTARGSPPTVLCCGCHRVEQGSGPSSRGRVAPSPALHPHRCWPLRRPTCSGNSSDARRDGGDNGQSERRDKAATGNYKRHGAPYVGRGARERGQAREWHATNCCRVVRWIPPDVMSFRTPGVRRASPVSGRAASCPRLVAHWTQAGYVRRSNAAASRGATQTPHRGRNTQPGGSPGESGA